MPFDLSDTQFTGPALPDPFVKFELENELTKHKLLPKMIGSEGKQLKADWDVYRRELAKLAVRGGYIHVRNQTIRPLCKHLGYDGEEIESAADVETREGREGGGYLLVARSGAKLRVWTTDFDEDLDAPAKRGQAYRFSHLRIAQRVLLATGERVGLLTNGVELRLLISDPARPDSQVIFTLDPNWKRSREVPDSFRLLLALASPAGVQKIPDLVDKARLQQARVTKDLRDQARQAIGRFIQEVLDHPDNGPCLAEHQDQAALARALWHEGLIIVYRLLFVLKLESSDDPARSFTFASTSLWRNTFSPSMALARYAPKVLYDGVETGGLLEHGLRGLFRMFHEGVECTELNVKSLGGALFSADATPVLSRLRWGERAVAHLLDQLLWTTPKKRTGTRERVHYGPLDVEDLGRVYEALLELEPGIAAEPMCRLRRQKLEVVVPVAQGEKYRPAKPIEAADEEDIDEPEEEEEDEEAPKKGKKTTVQWIEEIQPGKFYLRVGLGRKATGSYYTPHSFVRFLVQETLGPQVAERSPQDDPQPGEILKLKVLDPAMGSGHFLVEACRFLGEKLYEAVRLCDEKASELERKAENSGKTKAPIPDLLAEAQKYRQRVINLPDPDDELLRYLPSRSVEGDQSGVSQRRAEALCRRLVAVHCLYGVDKNPLAVELAKLALWLESHAEGMPLTFLDHRLVVGDSLTGPFWEQLLSWPSKPKEKFKEGVYRHIETHLRSALFDALRHVRRLEATVGVSLAEVNDKTQAKAELDEALLPFRVAAAAWSGGVMLGEKGCDDAAYIALLEHVGTHHELPDKIESVSLRKMIARGLGVSEVPPNSQDIANLLVSGRCTPALSYDLTFPEVFYPNGVPYSRHGLQAVVTNPPWDAIRPASKEFYASLDIAVLEAPTARERAARLKELDLDPVVQEAWRAYEAIFEGQKNCHNVLYSYQKVVVAGDLAGRYSDIYRVFAERMVQLLGSGGLVGVVVPSAFHANEGATGIRQFYLDKTQLRLCYSFENRRKLFEIDSRFKFALVVAEAGGTTTQFSCAFYLHDDDWLFAERDGRQPLTYTRDFLRQTGGDYLSFVELRNPSDVDVLRQIVENGRSLESLEASEHITLRTEPIAFNVTTHGPLFTAARTIVAHTNDIRRGTAFTDLLDGGYFVMQEGKFFNQFTDLWEDSPRYLVHVERALERPASVPNTRFFRLAFRTIASSTNERTAIFTLLPPGVLVTNSVGIEATPDNRPDRIALAVCALLDSFCFDFTVRVKGGANMNLFIMRSGILPNQSPEPFLMHNVLRLVANHSGYAPLWREQLGEAWREDSKPPMTWPVRAGDDERWAVRAAIDAVVANAYGLSRDQYAHVLSTFSHASYPKAPELCLARFDELKKLGLETFTRKYDPYWDIPLNENLPQPVIDLPIPGEAQEEDDGAFRLADRPKRAKGRKRK